MKYPSFLMLFLLSSLSALGQDNVQEQTILLCDRIEDEELKVVCEQFHQALVEKHLVSPEGTAAYDQYKKLEKADPLPGLVLALRIKLISALQQELDDALDVASRITLNQNALQLIYGRDFSEYQAFAGKAAELLGQKGEESAELKWQLLYFRGLEQREKARQLDSKDTTLLIPVIETQLEALKSGPNQAHIHQEIGEMLFDAKSYNQSKVFFLQANASAPEQAVPLIGLSQFLFKFKEEKQALAMAAKAIDLQTDFSQSYLNAARLSAQSNQVNSSVTYYHQAFDKLIADITSGPETFKWYNAYLLSELLVEFELYEQAEICLKKILAHQETPDAYLLLGELYEYTNRTLSADSLYRRCVALWPDHIGPYLRGGALYQGIGRYALAKPFFEQAYALNPQHREVCFNLGSLRHLYKSTDEAELLYKQSLVYQNGMKPVHDEIGRMVKEADAKRSKMQIKLATALSDPDAFFKSKFAFSGPPVSSYEDFIYANLGDLYFEQKRMDEAIFMYKNALLLNPGLEEVYKKLIQAFYDKEDFNGAMTYIQLYQLYVPYTRETKEDWKVMGKTSRELFQKKVAKVSDLELNVHTFFMDNFWNYIYGMNQEEKGLNLDRTVILRQQRLIQQTLKKNKVIDRLK